MVQPHIPFICKVLLRNSFFYSRRPRYSLFSSPPWERGCLETHRSGLGCMCVWFGWIARRSGNSSTLTHPGFHLINSALHQMPGFLEEHFLSALLEKADPGLTAMLCGLFCMDIFCFISLTNTMLDPIKAGMFKYRLHPLQF